MQQIFFPTILSHQRTKCTNQKASKASITTSVLFGCSDFAFFIQFQRYLHNRHNIYLLQSRGKLRWKHKPTAKHKWEAVSRHGFSSTILTSTIVKELQCCGILIRAGVWVWLRQKKILKYFAPPYQDFPNILIYKIRMGTTSKLGFWKYSWDFLLWLKLENWERLQGQSFKRYFGIF